MNKDAHCYSSQQQSYESVCQLNESEIIQMKEALKNKKQKNQNLNPLLSQPNKKIATQPKSYHKELALLSNHSNRDAYKKIVILSKPEQNLSHSQQNIRKSKRLKEKRQRKYFSSQPAKSYTSMIKKSQKQHKSEENREFNRPLIERLKNPGNATLRQTQITFKKNQFYYSINIKNHQYCTKHKIDKKSIQTLTQSQEQILKQQSSTCNFCKKIGTYWFSSNQLRKFNNGNFIRKYLETFI